jgi:hypothetical protein
MTQGAEPRVFLTAMLRANKLPVSRKSGEDGSQRKTMHPIEIARIADSCKWKGRAFLVTTVLVLVARAHGQACLSGDDMEPATRSALQATASRYFDMAAKGDVAGLRQNAIAGVASDFGGIEAAVRDSQPNFSGAQATIQTTYFLQVEGKEPLARAEFLCGVFGKQGQTSNSAVFVIPNLPPGEYGVVILGVASAEGGERLEVGGILCAAIAGCRTRRAVVLE